MQCLLQVMFLEEPSSKKDMFTSVRNVIEKMNSFMFSVKHRKAFRFKKCCCVCWEW